MSLDTQPYINASLPDLAATEDVRLSRFDSDVAWEIGVVAKRLAKEYGFSKAILIDVTTADGTTFFHSPSKPTTVKDNDIWVQRKQKTVFRFGFSSFYMGTKLKTKSLASQSRLTVEDAFFISSIEYAVHGGSIPIRLENFDGVIAALTVSGLDQVEDHAFAIEVLKKVAKDLQSSL